MKTPQNAKNETILGDSPVSVFSKIGESVTEMDVISLEHQYIEN